MIGFGTMRSSNEFSRNHSASEHRLLSRAIDAAASRRDRGDGGLIDNVPCFVLPQHDRDEDKDAVNDAPVIDIC